MRLRFGRGHLDGNSHICEPYGYGLTMDGLRYRFRTKRGWSLSLVELGKECIRIVEGRLLIGWRLYLYAPTGECWNLDAMIVFDQSPYPEGHRFGPRPDWKPEQATAL